MLIKNKTSMFQMCGDVKVWPWRDAEVPEGTEIDPDKFEIINKKGE